MSTKNILAGLSEAGGYITLAMELGGELVPLVKGVVKAITSIGKGQDTVSYVILLQTDAAELDAVGKLASDDLAAINAELAKLGQAAIAPPEPASTAPRPVAVPPAAAPATPAAAIGDPGAHGAVGEAGTIKPPTAG